MKVENFLNIAQRQVGQNRSEDIKKEQAATDFEEIFARHLVNELTKDSFKMADNETGMGKSNSLYREFITDALASELAEQRKLGMGDLVSKYWNNSSQQNKEQQT
jgi:Rod binding domain-containing protein